MVTTKTVMRANGVDVVFLVLKGPPTTSAVSADVLCKG
jgi:hypothetical protein